LPPAMIEPQDEIASWRTKVATSSSSGFEGDAPIEVLDAEDVLGIGLGSDILVVDDDATNLTAYEAALAPLGRALVLVQSGVAALARLLEQDFALLLLDVSMPDMTGLETARRIRQRPRNRGLPIIFITGMTSSVDVVLEAYEAGAFDFIVKPILPEVLRAKARVYLQLQERTQALRRHAAQLRAAHKLLEEADEKLRDRDAAAATARRLQKLQEATAALAQASTPAEVAAVAVRLGAEAVDASAACLWGVRADGALTLEGSQGVPEPYLDGWRVIAPDSALLMTRVLHSRQPIWIENEADFVREAPEIYDRARAAGRVLGLSVLPLVAGERAIGVLAFSFGADHAFPDEDRRFLAAIARTCEQALDRSRLYVAEAVARRTAEDANRRKDEFLAMLGHELRNPLWAAVTALESIKLSGKAAAGSAGNDLGPELAIVGRQVDRLTHIVGDLLDVARITRGKITLRREAVQLAGAVADALAGARPLIERRAHEVAVDIADQLLVDADRHRVRQVLENLLFNAAEYTAEHGRIEIAAQADGGFAQIIVRDNGRGIPASLLSSLFELFVQGEQPLDRSQGGLGVGLTIARRLVELHGGTIDAHSGGPGTGATFTVRWPLASERTPTGELRPLPRPSATIPRRILIVDDNIDAAELLAALLETLGHAVALAHDGAAALAIAPGFAPDVALLDIGLPLMDGYELAQRLRQLEGCRQTLLVAVTGYGQADDRQRSRDAGFAHHLVKPVELATLTALLDTVRDGE
jgi:signal transduction histidine kinase/DNA-binding response OmpR family regulator